MEEGFAGNVGWVRGGCLSPDSTPTGHLVTRWPPEPPLTLSFIPCFLGTVAFVVSILPPLGESGVAGKPPHSLPAQGALSRRSCQATTSPRGARRVGGLEGVCGGDVPGGCSEF